MSLDDLIGNTAPITSRRKVSNYTLSKQQWKYVVLNDPWLPEYLCSRRADSEIKMWISLIDEILEDGVQGVKITDGQKEELESARGELISRL